MIVFAALIIGCGACCAQATKDFESQKIEAYHKFHRGEVRQAAREIRLLANQTEDKATKASLLRDLTEICAAAFEANCALEAEIQAFEIANSNEALKPLIPELYSYFIAAQVWLGNKEALNTIFKDDAPPNFNPAQNPFAAASANLTASIYFMRANNHRAAEAAYSTAVMSLLLLDPKNNYAISKVLVEMIEALIVQQDIVGASSLLRMADPYLTANLNHDGPYWAKYAYLGAQLAAITTRNLAVVPALAEASRLVARQDINEGVKTYRLATNNSLQSLTLLFNGRLEEALAIHAQHPLTPQRDAIIQRGEFDTHQEFFFAISDILIEDIRGKDASRWGLLFEKPITKWQLDALEFRNIESYRNFALGVVASKTSKRGAAELYQLAARQRIENFDQVLKRRFEGFQLPTTIDFLVIQAALTSLEDYPPPDRDDLMLKGSEMLLRSLRHQISDFAVLIGSQPSERLRANARSYNLLVQQKRSWELQQIGSLLGSEPRDVGALISTYSQLVSLISRVERSLANSPTYSDAIGYPDARQLQSSLDGDEVFITYFPTFKGIGRLCVSKSSTVSSFSSLDLQQLLADVKLVQFALAADYAPDEQLDAQFPAASSIRLEQFLFAGLEPCMTEGRHVNVAVPNELAGIPLAALLEEEPPRAGTGYQLKSAKWLGKRFSFSTIVSARHFIGTRASARHQQARKPYLGVGNPDLARPAAPANTEAKAVLELNQTSLSDLPALPETADELFAVQRLLGADSRQVLVASNATEEALRSEDLGKYDVIHFATHGLLKGDIGGLSEPALVLTPGTPGDSFDDGILTASEITRLSLNARLIVLSACNTAKVDTSAVNIGAADLQAAFAVAGSPTLLASLWTVESSTARDLMIGFFQEWRGQDRKSASEALAQATRNYLSKADLAHQNPRFWAAFVVLGDGGKLTAGTPSSAIMQSFMPIDPSVGEVIDAKSFGNSVVVSMQGDWDGRTMAGIVKDARAKDDNGVRSHEIGAGGLVVANQALYATGYRISEHPIPVIRKITNVGRVEWERSFDDLVNYAFSDGRYLDDHIFLVAQPLYEDKTNPPRIVVLKLDLSGNEVARATITTLFSNLLIGKKSFLSRSASGLVLLVNSQELSAMDQTRRERFGLPSWCLGKLSTTVHAIDLASMNITTMGTVADFQTFSAEEVEGRIMLGGMKRSACSDSGAAAVYDITSPEMPRLFWIDNDLFPSNVQSVRRFDTGLAVAVKRQRPVGVRSVAQSTAGTSKRWGDDGSELWEFSILEIDLNGGVAGRYDSEFGLSSFVQGIVVTNGGLVAFGSLGGRPALSVLVSP